jgi:polysaccharide biosynthesis transport protein
MSDISEQGEIPCGRSSGRSRWKLAIGLSLGAIVLVAIVAAAWYGIDAARSYTADAYIRCAFRPETAFSGDNAPPPSELEYEVFRNTQMSAMTNRLVLNTALYRETKVRDQKCVIAKFPMFADASDPIEYLTKKLSVSFPRKDEIMKISITTYDPVQSAAIVAAVREAYMSEVVDAERKQREEKISELNGIKIGKQQEVKDAMTELRKIADTLGTTDTEAISQKQKIILDELATLRGEAIRNQFEYNRMMGELAAHKAERDAVESVPISDLECQQVGAFDPLLKKLGEELASREVTAEAKDQAQTDALKKKYAERVDRIREEIRCRNMAECEKEVKRLEAAIEIAKKQHEVAQEELKSLKKEADRIGVQSIDMQMRRAAIVNAQKALDKITAELEKMNVEAKTTPRVTRYGGDPEPPKQAAPLF